MERGETRKYIWREERLESIHGETRNQKVYLENGETTKYTWREERLESVHEERRNQKVYEESWTRKMIDN